MIKLGSVASCKFTGFTGIVMAKTEYLYGCNRYGLLPIELKEGNVQEWSWFDEPQLIEGRVGGDPGGERPDAPGR